MKFLERFAKKPFSLKQEIHRRLAGVEPPRQHKHDDGTLRASDLLKTDYEFCPREHAFMDMGLVKKKGSFVGTSLRMTYDHGAYMERQIRDNYVQDTVVGNWVCGICKTRYALFGKYPTAKCSKCGWGHMWKYEEPRFKSAYYGVSGGIDFMLDVKNPKLLPVELKTMGPDEFKKLAAPLAEHKMRSALYLKLIAESQWAEAKRVDSKTIHILYVMKSFGIKDESLKAAGIKDAAFSPFKEFVIQRNDAIVQNSLNKALALKVWRDTQKGMPCGVCPNGLTKRAQSCPAVGPCFSGKFQSTLTWYENGMPKHPGKQIVN